MSNSALYIVSIFLNLCAPLVSTIALQTELGSILGTTETAFNGKTVETFLGIPYAKPPVGKLRFAHPVPYGSLGDNFDATKYGARCPTPDVYDFMYQGFPESENCLFLNVFRPSGVNKFSGLPVLVVIHGGAFTFGHGSEPQFHGHSLASEIEVIVVTLNYRLGVLGFADMGDLAPGNLGLFDQKLALEWVQENIADFGGNRSKVTLMGVSAGSMSIFAHLISPLTRDNNLFHSAIMDAGALGEGIAQPPEINIGRVKKLASKVNCASEGIKMLECLRGTDVDTLVERSFDDVYSFILTFIPSLDGKFLPKDLVVDLRKNANKYMKIPIIIGHADNEGSLFVRASMRPTQQDPVLESEEDFKKWCSRLSNAFKYPFDFNDDETTRKLLDVYYKPHNNKLQGASDLIADGTFICPINAFLAEYRKHNKNIYFYKFDRVIKQNYGFDPEVLGAFHTSPFLHFMGAFLPFGEKAVAEDTGFSLDFMQLVNDFLHGKPLKFSGVTWPSFSDQGQLLQIDETHQILDEPIHVSNCKIMHPHYSVTGPTRQEL